MGQRRVLLPHAGVDQHTCIGMVEHVHLDRHPLALDVEVGNEDGMRGLGGKAARSDRRHTHIPSVVASMCADQPPCPHWGGADSTFVLSPTAHRWAVLVPRDSARCGSARRITSPARSTKSLQDTPQPWSTACAFSTHIVVVRLTSRPNS